MEGERKLDGTSRLEDRHACAWCVVCVKNMLSITKRENIYIFSLISLERCFLAIITLNLSKSDVDAFACG